MQRRAFLGVGSGAVLATSFGVLHPRASFANQLGPISSALEQRIANVIETYDSQGNHRTATPVDNASAQWLAKLVEEIGPKVELESFPVNRVDPQSCYVRIAGRRIEGVPLFDATFTDAGGISGRLGPLGSEVEIGFTETEPFSLAEPRRTQAGVVTQARRSRHKAVLLATAGTRPGLFLLNAVTFSKPSGPPTIQISSVESTWVKAQVELRAEATVVAQVNRTVTQAINVTAKIPGRDPGLAPVVLMAPRSAWWQSASEQGSRLACWLEAIRAIAAAAPVRDTYFVAPSGHELGLLGIEAYIQRRPELVKRALVWFLFGSDIGAPRQSNLIHASDAFLETWLARALESEGLAADARAPKESPARGEAGPVQRGGGRFATVACGSEAFHNVADRWPEAIDVSLLSRYARAIAGAVLALANQPA